MDTIYSRILKADNCISWYSDTTKPDLGGIKGTKNYSYFFYLIYCKMMITEY